MGQEILKPDRVYAELHARCRWLGVRLFTITTQDEAAGVTRRAYTSHPVDYPLLGTKPLDHDDWYAQCIVPKAIFVANSPSEFETLFFDHALITSLGLGSAANIPVWEGEGPVIGTVNILAGAGHFTPTRTAAYLGLCQGLWPDLVAAMAADWQGRK